MFFHLILNVVDILVADPLQNQMYLYNYCDVLVTARTVQSLFCFNTDSIIKSVSPLLVDIQ